MAQGDCAKEVTEYESPHDEKSQLLTFNEPFGDVVCLSDNGQDPQRSTASIRHRQHPTENPSKRYTLLNYNLRNLIRHL